MNKALDKYQPVALAISRLFFPHVEVVIHDLSSGTIAAIYNPFTKRKAGDESLLDGAASAQTIPDVFPLYTQTAWDGKKLRSVTAALKDERGKPIGLMCLNMDITQWEGLRHLLAGWLDGGLEEERPEYLFKDDWREKINSFVKTYLHNRGLTLKGADSRVKREIILALHAEGAFKAKNAAAHAAEVVGLSRATIYNYLKGVA